MWRPEAARALSNLRGKRTGNSQSTFPCHRRCGEGIGGSWRRLPGTDQSIDCTACCATCQSVQRGQGSGVARAGPGSWSGRGTAYPSNVEAVLSVQGFSGLPSAAMGTRAGAGGCAGLDARGRRYGDWATKGIVRLGGDAYLTGDQPSDQRSANGSGDPRASPSPRRNAPVSARIDAAGPGDAGCICSQQAWRACSPPD